jgi:predicted nucleotidyltransferase
MSGSLDSLVERLRKALGGDLISVVLYGSAAAGDHDPKFSDYNVLCVLNSITPVQLGATESIFRWWRQESNPAPLLLTEHEVQTSTDCFPIEFEDIKAHHRILYGRDVVSSIAVDRCFYRAQVEHDLRAKLLRLRQKASGILSDKAVLVRLMVDSISTFCVLFRHALILCGAQNGDVPSRKREVIVRAQERFGIDPAPFNELLDHREQKGKSKEHDPAALLAAYMNEIGKVIDAVDALEKGISG